MNTNCEKSTTSDELRHEAWRATAEVAGVVDAGRLRHAVMSVDALLSELGASEPVLRKLGADPVPATRMALARSAPPALLARGDEATREALAAGTAPERVSVSPAVADFLPPLSSQWLSGFCVGLYLSRGSPVTESGIVAAVRQIDRWDSMILRDMLDYESARDVAAERAGLLLAGLEAAGHGKRRLSPEEKRDEAAALAATWLDGLAAGLAARRGGDGHANGTDSGTDR